jgi:hypothetical protein
MSLTGPITGAVVALVVVALVAGLVVGVSVSETDLLNPSTSQAEANRIDRDTEYEAQIREIDLEYYRAERAAQADALEQGYQQDALYEQKQRVQSLENAQRRDDAELSLLPVQRIGLTAAGSLALLTVAGGLTYYLISLGKTIQRKGQDPWQSSEMRQAVRRVAQANERLWRDYQRIVYGHAPSSGNGRERETAREYARSSVGRHGP